MKHNRTKTTNAVSTRALMESALVEAYYPCKDQVLDVKEYLDHNFIPSLASDLDSDGQLAMVRSVKRKIGNGCTQDMRLSELLLHLDGRYRNMVADQHDRRRLMKQIIIDWLNGTIGSSGVLSVNVV